MSIADISNCGCILQLKLKFGEVYGITNALTTAVFKFDGDVLKNDQTPSALDMEDDMIIDVEVLLSCIADLGNVEIHF